MNFFAFLVLLCHFVLDCKARNDTFYNLHQDTEQLDGLEFDTPTEEEIERAIRIRAPRLWGGKSVLVDKSFRILLLGGSNTANPRGYSHILKNDIALLVEQKTIGSDSYVVNEGVPGNGPDAVFHKKFAFESWPKEQWPNIIFLEFSVNAEGWLGAEMMSKLFNLMTIKWVNNGASQPSFLIIELFSIGSFYYCPVNQVYDCTFMPTDYDRAETVELVKESRLNNSTSLERLNLPEALGSRPAYSLFGFNGGCKSAPYVTTFALYHRIPLLSLSDCMRHSFIRFYLSASTDDPREQMWPFIKDGIHISVLGSAFLVRKVILPFLEDHVASNQHRVPKDVALVDEKGSHSSSNAVDPGILGDYNVHLFKKSVYGVSGMIESFTSWGTRENTLVSKQFNDIIQPTTDDWKLYDSRGHPDGLHQCWGSTGAPSPQKSSKTQFFFLLHYRECSMPGNCGVRVRYLHSWDATYIGDITCQLYRFGEWGFQQNHNGMTIAERMPKLNTTGIIPGKGYTITGQSHNGQSVKDTTVRSHDLHKNLPHGEYLLECTKPPSARPLLSCFAGILLLGPESQNV